MNAVRENPYRTLGLFGNTSEKELQKQIAIIKRYAEVGKSKSFDYDFPFLGSLIRQQESVTDAASKIEQAHNKVHYSLFWFINTSHIDNAALDHLKESNVDKATEIWEKLLKTNTITSKNYSAALNLSTLHLGLLTLNGSFNTISFKKYLEMKGQIISSDAFVSFVQTVAGNNLSIDRDKILIEFVNEVLYILKPYLNKSNGISSVQLIDAFSSFPIIIKQYIVGKFIDGPINKVESMVEQTKIKRTNNEKDADKYGTELYQNIKEDIVFLTNVLGTNNIQYQVLANKVANEILQCAIDYYNEYQGSDELDPGEKAMRLMKISKSIATGGQVKSRIEDNIKNVQEWINDKPEREHAKKIKVELDFITAKLVRFQSLTDTIENANDLAVSCKPKLDKMKISLGSNDDFYLKISSFVVSNAMGMLVEAVNHGQDNFTSKVRYDRNSAVYEIRKIVGGALDVMRFLSSFDITSELKSRFYTNKNALQSIGSQIGLSSSSSSSGSSSSSSGCYIATMAYGNYEHPQVLQLRNFRDMRLAQSELGRRFIIFYYNYSPKLVEVLKDKPAINSLLRFFLNLFIRIIK